MHVTITFLHFFSFVMFIFLVWYVSLLALLISFFLKRKKDVHQSLIVMALILLTK